MVSATRKIFVMRKLSIFRNGFVTFHTPLFLLHFSSYIGHFETILEHFKVHFGLFLSLLKAISFGNFPPYLAISNGISIICFLVKSIKNLTKKPEVLSSKHRNRTVKLRSNKWWLSEAKSSWRPIPASSGPKKESQPNCFCSSSRSSEWTSSYTDWWITSDWWNPR